jgi:hypothetical protein
MVSLLIMVWPGCQTNNSSLFCVRFTQSTNIPQYSRIRLPFIITEAKYCTVVPSVLWIRIKENSGSASNKNQNPNPHPDTHESDKQDPEADPDPHQFADDKPKCMEYEPI